MNHAATVNSVDCPPPSLPLDVDYWIEFRGELWQVLAMCLADVRFLDSAVAYLLVNAVGNTVELPSHLLAQSHRQRWLH